MSGQESLVTVCVVTFDRKEREGEGSSEYRVVRLASGKGDAPDKQVPGIAEQDGRWTYTLHKRS